MALIEGKQVDITSVINAMETIFNASPTITEQFINALFGTNGTNNKVQTSSQDPNPPDYLVSKLNANDTDPYISLTVGLSTDKSQVLITPSLNYNTLSNILLAGIRIIPYTATATQSIYVDTVNLLDTVIVIMTREGREIYSGTLPDEYQYNADAATITFNTPLESGERIKIVTCGDSNLDNSAIASLTQQVQQALAAIQQPIINQYSTNSSYAIPVGTVLEKIVVMPTSNLTSFGVGLTNGGYEISPAVPVNANAADLFELNVYNNGGKIVWFNGITASTTIKIYIR